MQYLARRNHSAAELKQKLWYVLAQKRGSISNSLSVLSLECLKQKIDAVVKFCKQNHWQSDSDYAKCYYQTRQDNGYGHKRILEELKQ